VVMMLLVAVRLMAVLMATGYIHPDEYFQSPEVVAGEVFGIHTQRAWEFDPSDAPARSIVPTYVISGLPMLLTSFFVPGT